MPVTLFKLNFENITQREAVLRIIEKAREGVKGLVVTPNVDHIVLMQDDPEMFGIFQSALFVFADGMPLVWLGRLVYGRAAFPERVAGADLLPMVCAGAAKAGLRVYFLGGAPGVAEKARENLCLLHPHLIVAGTYCPPIGFERDVEETARIIEEINNSNVALLFLGVGTPKQEKWAQAHLTSLRVGPILCVGAAFDFAARTKKRAPIGLQRIGLEWLWRLLNEPRRLWKRYLIQDSTFLRLAIREMRHRRRGQA